MAEAVREKRKSKSKKPKVKKKDASAVVGGHLPSHMFSGNAEGEERNEVPELKNELFTPKEESHDTVKDNTQPVIPGEEEVSNYSKLHGTGQENLSDKNTTDNEPVTVAQSQDEGNDGKPPEAGQSENETKASNIGLDTGQSENETSVPNSVISGSLHDKDGLAESKDEDAQLDQPHIEDKIKQLEKLECEENQKQLVENTQENPGQDKQGEGKLYPDLSDQITDYMKSLEKKQQNLLHVQSQPITTDTAPQLAQQSQPATTDTAPQLAQPFVIHHQQNQLQQQQQLPEQYHQQQPQQQQQQQQRTTLERHNSLQPLTLEQLNSLYYNPKLEINIEFIDRFVQSEIKPEKHEFYEILLNYQRARKNFLACEAGLKSLEASYTQFQQEVWVTETHTIVAKGVCGDQSRCTVTHAYEQMRLNHTAMGDMKKTLERIQDQIQNQLSLHSYSVQLSKLQVESYIHNIFVTSQTLRDIPRNLPVYACEHQNPSSIHEINGLRTCISILFMFHRLPIDDEELLNSLQLWTERLVSAFLRVSTFDDHLYILNHIMRCPGGIGSWASHFIQAPTIPTNENLSPLMFGNAYLDHFMTALSTVLIPTSARTDFLCQMQKMFTPGADNKTISWVMVDSDGEEDEDPQNAWMYLHENDVVAVLKQLPLAAIFRHIFFIEHSQFQDCYEYDIQKTSESTMYRMFAFCTCLVGILGEGLKTYNMARYRQLNKRLGRMIRQCVQLVSDHWENYHAANQGLMPAESLQKLQVEFDAFFLRAVNFIHMSQRLGSWQFIADMPFNNISKSTMWKLLWLLHQGHGQWSLDLSSIPPVQQCMDFVKDSSSHSQLSDVLQSVPVSEGIYLLNTMTNMTQCCSSADISFIETVTLSVFEISYICPETRDSCSKMGRELLSSVVMCHPFMLSILTQHVHEYMDRLGVMGLYLYKGLSLEAWLPTDPDILILRQWLLNTNLGSPEHLLAQLILSSINWGMSHQGNRLMVPWRVHKQVAVLIVEAYQKFILGKHLGSLIMEGVKQMSAVVRQHPTNEQEFHSWCWDLLLKLSLHRSCLPQDDHRLANAQNDLPDLDKDDAFLPLVKGIKEKNPASCFVSLLLTKLGHSTTDFISDGIPLLQVLTEQGLFKCTLSVFSYTLPMFLYNHKSLLDSVRFEQVLLPILQADESYFRVVKGLLSYDFPGPITKLLTSMIQSQIDKLRTNQDHMGQMIALWTKLIMKLPKWHQDRNCCCVLDNLIQVSFTHRPAFDIELDIFQQRFKEYCKKEKHQGVVSSIVNWVTSGVVLPSFIDKSSYPECSWLAFMVLSVEGNYEQETKLWSSMQEELLFNPKSSTDQALKKAIMKLKLEHAPAYSRLSIFRLAQQALDMPVSHPVAVLVWQRFFVLYLGRFSNVTTSLPQRASVGERFFTGIGYSSMVKKMKKKLGETADYYLKQTSDANTPSGDADGEAETAEGSKELHYKLARLYQALQLWVEEPLLHDATLYLPSLPPQYQSDKLLTIFQNQTSPWMEFLDIKNEVTNLVAMATEWRRSSTPEQNTKAAFPKNERTKSGKERILCRLAKYDHPLPPPDIHGIKAPVPEISSVIMDDRAAILHLLESDLNMLKEYAGRFCCQMCQHVTLDHYYVKLVPKLFENVTKQVTLALKCSSMINPLHKCSKPGSVIVKIDEKRNDPITQRQADENRAEYRQLLIQTKLPPSQNIVICAVHTENAITLLVKLYRSCADPTRLKQLNTVACTLFFRLANIVTDSIKKYPPTQQFFSSCIDILGQEFIQKDAEQPECVLQTAIERPDVAGLIASHFIPIMSPRLFVSMYQKLAKTLQKGNFELTFMLLTKFDVGRWLVEYNPSKQEVKQFVEVLSGALITCGAEPDEKIKLVFGIYVGHEKILLQHRFPLYLHEILAALLQGSSVQKINVECWDVLQQQCFQGNETGENQIYPDVFTNLSTDEIRNIVHWLGHEFLQIRLNQKEATTFGLYPKWQRYVPSLAMFLRDMTKCFVEKMIPSLVDAATNEGLDAVWRTVVEGFSPWLQPLYSKGIASMPWIEADRETAGHMVKALCHLVGYAHYKTNDIRGKFFNDFLSLLWLYFATVLCKVDVTPDVIGVFNLEWTSLPWQQMIPNIQVMETLAQLKEYGNSLGFNLAADIVSVINWEQVTAWYEKYHDLDTKVRYEGCLFLLLIQAYSEKKHIENPDMERILTQAETYRWRHLSADAFCKSCAWFLQSCDPKCLLHERTSPQAIGLRVLKSASGFTRDESLMLTAEWTARRLSYLHCLSSLICQCTYLDDVDPSSLSTVIINLLTEIETVESAVPDMYQQCEECTDMMKEVLSLLNNCNPDNQGADVVMTTIVQWLEDSPQTILLSPCIRAASRNLASLKNLVQIVEQCIQLLFVPGGQHQTTSDPWGKVLAAVQVPELNLTEFFTACLQESSFLLLYCYVQQKAPLCQSLTEEQGLVEVILDWTDKAKPSAENECKLLLWWHHVVVLILRQLDFGGDITTCVSLVRKFIHKLQVYGEDRASVGLLGAIGFGKKSLLTEKFRLCCRALVSFCSNQIMGDTQLRLQPSDHISNLPVAKQDLSALLSLKSNKKYQQIKNEVDMTCDFVTDQSKCLRDVLVLISMLKQWFYTDKDYLSQIPKLAST